MGLGLLLFAGKYILLIAIYAFVIVLFRALLTQATRGAGAELEAAVEPVAPPMVQAPVAAAPPAVTVRSTVQPRPAPQPRVEIEPTRQQVAAPVPARPSLVVMRSAAAPVGQRIALAPLTTIGRGPQNTAILPDHYASHEHAQVILRDGICLLRDLQSTNGTFVNGRRISADTPLREGDQIAVGTTLLRYTEGG